MGHQAASSAASAIREGQLSFLLRGDFWAWNGWIAVGALVTAAMAVATAYMARRSRDAITEIRRDRELTFRPYISWELGSGTYVNAVNFGKGPALNAIFCTVDEDQKTWSTTAPMLRDFSPDQKTSNSDQIMLTPGTGPIPPRPKVGNTVPRKVAFCEDHLGNRYRFLPGAVIADVWRPGKRKPDWVAWYEGNAPIAPRA